MIDSPPQSIPSQGGVRAADIVLVPIQPSLPDVVGCRGYACACRRGTAQGASGVQSRAADLAAAGDDRSRPCARRLPLLRSTLGNRAGFAHAFAAGLGVTEAAPRITAAAELRALLAELQELTANSTAFVDFQSDIEVQSECEPAGQIESAAFPTADGIGPLHITERTFKTERAIKRSAARNLHRTLDCFDCGASGEHASEQRTACRGRPCAPGR